MLNPEDYPDILSLEIIFAHVVHENKGATTNSSTTSNRNDVASMLLAIKPSNLNDSFEREEEWSTLQNGCEFTF